MHELIQSILQWYFGLLDSAGLWGVTLLMAMESTIVPIPSELIIPPAAYLEVYQQGNSPLAALLLILAGTLGCYLGSATTYLISRAVGRPFLVRYGRYVLVPEAKLHLAEAWVARYGQGGIFFARLLPVVRHLISIPAGAVGMDFRAFSKMTLLGSGLWCTVLTVFGMLMGQDLAAVLQAGAATDAYEAAFHRLTIAVVVAVTVLGVLYVLVVRRGSGSQAPAKEG